MKRIMIIMLLLMGVSTVTAQAVTVTTITSNCCWYDEEKKTYDKDCSFDAYKSSRLVFNEEQTMIVHTTEAMTSTYYVNYQEHVTKLDDGTEVDYYWYEITSDVGNNYSLAIDIKYNSVTFMPTGGGYMIRSTIKSIFK
jgi:hypothetical protein